jgi:hypothetical protein
MLRFTPDPAARPRQPDDMASGSDVTAPRSKGSIAGMVLDDYGRPVAEAQVRIVTGPSYPTRP